MAVCRFLILFIKYNVPAPSEEGRKVCAAGHMKDGAKSLIRKLLLGILIVSVILALLFVPTGLKWSLAGRSGSSASPPQYALDGPKLVGMRNISIGDGAPLNLTIWYPAPENNNRNPKTRYPYPIKMGDPFGMVSIASYSGQALTEAPFDLSESPYAVVVLSPGFSLGVSAYAWLAEHLASYGLVVIAIEHQEEFDEGLNGLWRATIIRPQDILDVLAYLDDQANNGGVFAGFVDTELVAVIGHSYGGYTALASAGAQIDTAGFEALCESAYESNDTNTFLCDEVLPHLADMSELAGLDAVPEGLWPALADPRIDAIVPLAGDALFFGESGLASIAVPVLAIGGTLDHDSPYMWGTHPTYEYASTPTKARVALTDAEHMIFTGPCQRISLFLSFFTGEFCSDTHWDRTQAHALIKHFTTAFLLATLKNDLGAADALRPDRVDFPGVEFVSQGF